MPRLLLFGVCNKTIIDREDTSISLISLLNGIEVASEGEPFPAEAIIPFNWSVACVWLRQPDDEKMAYEQRINVKMPDGTIRGESVLPIQMIGRVHNNTVASAAFPIGQPGEYKTQLWLREAKEGEEWEFISDYPFEVIHKSSTEV